MTFGEDWGWGASKEECARILDAFGEAGGNFLDTANAYTNGSSEKIVGELISSERERWVVGTKFAGSTRAGDPNGGGSHRKSMVQSLEASLRRLGADYIDVYWVHIWDVFTPVEEVMRALDDLVRAGKVLYVGISDTPAWIVAQANTLAELRGWTPFVGLQVPYSLIERTPERELLPMARALDLAVTTWGPLGGGLLTGRHGTGWQGNAEGTRLGSNIARRGAENVLTDRATKIADAVNELAAERDATSTQVAIAWVMAQQERSVVIPVLGARSREQISDNLLAADLKLTAEEIGRLEEASRIDAGFPHDFHGRDLVYGGTYSLTDGHRPHIWPDL